MDLRSAKLKVISAVDGGWDVAAVYLGMSIAALRNRAYEVKGQVLSDEHTLTLQDLSKTTFYAEAIATRSGGTFVKLPADLSLANESLSKKFHELYTELGTLSAHFTAATSDDVIDDKERETLTDDGQRIHRVVAELQALMFAVFCPRSGERLNREVR